MHQKRLRVYIPVKRFVWIQYDKPASDISVNSRVIIFYCKRNFISFLKRVVHRGACCRIWDITGYGCPKFHGSALRGKRGVFIAATGSEPKGTGQQRQQSGQVLYLSYVNIKRPTHKAGQVYTKIDIKPSVLTKERLALMKTQMRLLYDDK